MIDKQENFQYIEKIGQGNYGEVFKCKKKDDGLIFAIKKYKQEDENQGIPATIMREISLLKKLNHINIVKLHDVIYYNKRQLLVFDYAQQDLKQYMISNQGAIPIRTIKIFMYQIIMGLVHCFTRKIQHRDIKPQNILIFDNYLVKLADFGLARPSGIPAKKYSDEVITLWYRPPDILLGSTNYTHVCDMWGVGCILAELISTDKKALFRGKDEKEQLDVIFKKCGVPKNTYWPEMKSFPNYQKYVENPNSIDNEMDMCQFNNVTKSKLELELEVGGNLSNLDLEGANLLRGMLEINPQHRSKAVNAINHPWFDEIRSELELQINHTEN